MSVPPSWAVMPTFKGKAAPFPGAKLPLKARVYTPGWVMVKSGELAVCSAAVP